MNCGYQCGEGHTYAAPCVLATVHRPPVADKAPVARLFLGGPWNGREVPIPADRDVYRVPVAEGGEMRYRRLRMAHRPTRTVRSVMVPDYWRVTVAEEELRAYLFRKWITAAPDATR